MSQLVRPGSWLADYINQYNQKYQPSRQPIPQPAQQQPMPQEPTREQRVAQIMAGPDRDVWIQYQNRLADIRRNSSARLAQRAQEAYNQADLGVRKNADERLLNDPVATAYLLARDPIIEELGQP